MAILFGRVSNVSRGGGGSAIKAAAYRSCSSLSLYATDKETNITVPLVWNYSSKKGLAYSQIHAPENAPEWVYDRQTLWQRVEDVEIKQNARLAGEYTMALPKEFTVEQNIALIKEFAEEVFVSRGIVVDVNFHNDNPNNPHAHFMYALRQLMEMMGGEIDFSTHRCRELQTRAFLEGVIKECHKRIQNVHLEKNGFEQKLEWGVAKGQEATIHHGGIKEVFAKNQEIILRNAERIVADPTIVIDKLDFNKAVFTKEHIEKELEKSLQITLKNIPVSDQSVLDIYIKNELVGLLDTVLLSPKLTLINACDLKGRMLFAKTEQVELEKRFIENVSDLAKKSEHSLILKEEDIAAYAAGKEFSTQQKQAIISICGGSDLSVLEGWPGAGKSTVTKEIARHYKDAGYEIIAAAPTNKAAQELEAKLGVKVFTTAALRMKWQYQRGASKVSVGLSHEYYKEPLYDLKEGVLDKKTLLIVDEASMLDVATADYFVSEVKKSGAKMLPLGDNNQNQAIGSKGAFARMSAVGNRNILTEVNRHQNTDLEIRNLHIEATSALCRYDVSKAISIYHQLGKINILGNEQEKEVAIAGRYVSKIMEIAKNESINIAEAAKQVVISSYTNAEIKSLNSMIRDSLKNAGALANSREFISGGVHGNSSMVELAEGDRIIFTRNLKEENGEVVVLNNELATVRKLLKVDAMGCGEFLVDIEGAGGIRRRLIQTGEEGKIVTFKHGYAITNSAVQGASTPYKLYSVDQYSGYSSVLVGLTRHKIDCEIFAARDTLENEVFKTKDLDVEKVKDEYQAIGYEWVAGKDEDGKDIQVKVDIPLWKLGLHLLANKRNDLSFAIDSSHGSVSVELQEQLQGHREQLEGLRQDLNGHEKVLGEFETLANTPLKDIGFTVKESVDNKDNTNSKSKNTQFELFVAQHFDLKENIIFDITDVMSASTSFKNNNIDSDGKQLKMEDYLSSLKAGIVSNGEVTRLNWSDLPKVDQDLVLWSYIDKEDRAKLETHYSSVRGLTEEIQDTADGASNIWQELQESGFKSHDALNGNYTVVSDYLAARVRVRDSFEQEEIFNKQLTSAKIQKLIIAEIENKYSLKLKFIRTNIKGIEKAGDDFASKKSSLDVERLTDNKEYQANSIEKDRELYLQSLKNSDFKEKLQNSNLFVHDIIESAEEGTELSNLRHFITQATKESAEAKAERTKLAGLIINNWDGHIDADAAKDQPSFERISAQMSFNRLTLLKHAEISQEKHYFKKLFNTTLGKNSDYQQIMHTISKVGGGELNISDISTLLKAHDGLCEHVELVTEYIEELKGERLSVQNNLNTGQARLKEIGIYQDTELPYFMDSIYKEDSKIIISKLDKLLAKTNDKTQLGKVISDNPEMLGDLKAHGLISKIFGSEEKRAVEVNLVNLGDRIGQYIKGKNEMQVLQKEVVSGNLANKLIEIDKEIKVLRSSLPNVTELNILEEIGGLQDSVLKSGTRKQDIDKFGKQLNELLLTDNAQDALFAYQTKHNVFFKTASKETGKVATNIDTNVEKTSIDKLLVDISVLNKGNELKQQFKKKAAIATQQKQQNHKYKEPSLTFAEVKAGLNQSVVSEIFRYYGSNIVPNKPIEKKGSQLKIGSLYMSVSGGKTGLWNRFSDGSKGDIFSFVEEATGCSKHESLTIVASHAGIVATSKDGIHTNSKAISAIVTQDIGDRQNPTQRTDDIWIASAIVPESALEFNSEKDLAFLVKKGNAIALTHEYKNKDNQLLGYAVRVEDIKTGKKQVLPVAYCQNVAKEKSRWQLKGFSDAGTKPIYGLEKLKQNLSKSILIVEGEKTADAASKLLPDHNVMSWMGGAQAVDKVDWSKLSNRVVSIWPDNDKPGIGAAKNIANHIDCHNGFSGLVSVVDTEKLGLPNKWDLADELPKDSDISNNNLSSIIDNEKEDNATKAGKQLSLSQELVINLGNHQRTLDSIDMLVATNRISKDEYISKEIYHDSVILIANSKNIDLAEIKDHKDFVSAVNSIQEEYQSLHRSYEQNILRAQDIGGSASGNIAGLNTKEQLAHDLIRDTSVLHQVQLSQDKLTQTHSEHIEKAVNTEIGKMQRFSDSDKEHAASNIYKVINSKGWREQLDASNLEKTSHISLRFTAKSIDEFLVATKSANHNEAQDHLENIRKYGIDESDILTTFKEGRVEGMSELKEMSDKLVIASGFAAGHSSVINDAQKWGYGGSDIDLTKSLVGMDIHQSKNHCVEIRDNVLSDYLNTHIAEFTSQKQYIPDMTIDNMKSVIKQEQDFLKEVYKEVQAPMADYSYNCRSKLEDGKVAHENPGLLDKSFAVIDKLRDEHELSHSDIASKVAQISDSSQMLKSLEKEYEHQQCFVHPETYSKQRKAAGSLKELLTIIGKEQDYLGNLHGNIKYYDKDLLAKCEIAHKQKEENALDSLKETAHQSLASGAKNEKELVSDLQQATDLKEAHTRLDKDIEIHHINGTLSEFKAEKQSAKTPNEIMNVIAKQQEFLVGLHDSLKYSEIHSSEVHQSITEAKDNKENGVFRDLQQVLEANQKQGIKSDKELTDILNNSHENIPKAIEDLKEMAAFGQKIHLRRQRIQIDCLEKLNYNVDKDKLVREVKSMTSEEREKYVDNILAKEIKKYVEPLIVHHTEEKAKATNVSELMAAIAKEQATYVHLHKNHEMAIYALDKSNGNMKLSVAASCANDIHNLGGINHAQKVIDHAIDHNIRTDNKIFDDLKNSQGNIKILSQDLHRECINHHKDQVDGHIKDLARNQDVFIGHHRFKDASTYLHHITKHHNHDYMPTDLINKHLQHIEYQHAELSKQTEHQHEHENQKELHMNKGMGGPSM